MNVTGIICEYNPFHNGHKYHIEQSSSICNADYIVGIMSGDFTQRGAPAITDKYSRARMALIGGCDIVIELPVRFATASAEGFAQGAVGILKKSGIVNNICFGSENGSLDELSSVADIIDAEPENYREFLQGSLREGLSYPLARDAALKNYCRIQGTDFNMDISLPNNILALEYIRACRHAGIGAYTVKRSGSDYHDTSLDNNTNGIHGPGMCSASALRHAIYENNSDISPYVPYRTTDYLLYPVHEDNYSMQLYTALTCNIDTLESFLDMSDELAARIRNNITSYVSWTQFTSLLKTKHYTYTRIQRALCHCMLGIRSDCGRKNNYPAPYIRILGFRKQSSGLMKKLKDSAEVPIITKACDIHSLSGSYAGAVLAEDIRAAELYEKTRSHIYGLPCEYNEYTHGMVIT